jgi:type I restriction enzyme M protein
MRKDKGLNGDLDRLPMLTWVMFLKFLDDMERLRETEAQLAGRPFRPDIAPPYRWRDWAGQTGRPHRRRPDRLRQQRRGHAPDGKRGAGLFFYLRGLQSADGADRRDVIATVFRGMQNRMADGYLLRDVINLVDAIHFTSSEEMHTLSRLYESLLKEMRDAAGDSGEFYTPRPVVRFMVRVMDPRWARPCSDPACGTGGFLVEAYKHLAAQCRTVEDRRTLQAGSILGRRAKPLPYLLAQMNLLLHGLDYPQHRLRQQPAHAAARPRRQASGWTVILTNPPFGGEEERGILGNFPQDKQTAETALLFLQLIMRRLRRPGAGKPGRAGRRGRAQRHPVRRRRLRPHQRGPAQDFNLHTIVRLPNGVFAPYTASRPTCSSSTAPGRPGHLVLPAARCPRAGARTTPRPSRCRTRSSPTAWPGGTTGGERARLEPSTSTSRTPTRPRTSSICRPEQLVEDILKKEQRIIEIMNDIKQLLAVAR